MARMKVEIIHPENAAVNGVLAEVERKWQKVRATPENVAVMEKEAARLIRRLIETRVTYVRD